MALHNEKSLSRGFRLFESSYVCFCDIPNVYPQIDTCRRDLVLEFSLSGPKNALIRCIQIVQAVEIMDLGPY